MSARRSGPTRCWRLVLTTPGVRRRYVPAMDTTLHLPSHTTLQQVGAPKCPACGFRVFNRRCPKCESCGAELPDWLVYSSSERQALLAADEQQDLERARNASTSVTAHPSFDEAVVSAVMALTES